MIAAQPLRHPQRRPVSAGIGVGRRALGFQRDLRIEVDGAFGAKPEAIARHRDMPGISAIEIFAQNFADPRLDALAQRLTDIEILP